MSSYPSEELSLHWKDFESHLAKSVSDMRDDSEFFDVKIACFDNKSEMQIIPAHKMVLSACSPVFKKLLHAIDNGDSKYPLLFLRGISYHDISAILDFIYNGQTKVPPNELDSFLAAAEELKVRGLSQENQRNEGYAINSTPSRKCASKDKQKESNVGLTSKVMSSRTIFFQKNEGGLSSSLVAVPLLDGNDEKIPEKAEKVKNEEEYDDYQDYMEVKMDDPFNDSTLQHPDHHKEESDNASPFLNDYEISMSSDFSFTENGSLKTCTASVKKPVESVHERKKSHKCSICESSFSSNKDMTRHIASVHENKKDHKCTICDTSFTTKNYLKLHVASVHEKKKPHKCIICNSPFTQNSSLKKHLRSVHDKSKPLKCKFCDKSFSLISDLKRHIAFVHEKQKPHKCRLCDKNFSFKQDLKRHIASLHENQKPHK